MRNLIVQSLVTSVLSLGAVACSDSDDDDPVESAGSGTGGTGSAMAGGAGMAGGMAMAGMGGGGMGGGGMGEQFPTPDKLVALTFDDGPAVGQSEDVLDKLESHQVPASLFLIGQLIGEGTQAVLQRAASLGCEFENHSFGFASLTGMTPEQVTTSVADTTAAIEQFTDDSPVFFRPPNLAIDDNMYQTIDMPFAGGIVAGDFPAEFGGNPTVEAVANAVLSRVQDGSIILMHDVQPSLDPHPTPEALDTIIPELKRRGYEIVTLRTLFERRGIDPNGMQDTIWDAVPPAAD